MCIQVKLPFHFLPAHSSEGQNRARRNSGGIEKIQMDRKSERRSKYFPRLSPSGSGFPADSSESSARASKTVVKPGLEIHVDFFDGSATDDRHPDGSITGERTPSENACTTRLYCVIATQSHVNNNFATFMFVL